MDSNFINLILLNISHKKKFLKTRLNKNNLNIIKILIKFNIIKYTQVNDGSVTFFFNYQRNQPNFKIKLIKKSNKKDSIKLKTLTQKVLKNKNILIVSTNKGFLTANECFKKKTGGIPVINLLLNS